MSQFFLENAHNRIDLKKFGEGWEHVFGKKEKEDECLMCGKECHKEELDGIACKECMDKANEGED